MTEQRLKPLSPENLFVKVRHSYAADGEHGPFAWAEIVDPPVPMEGRLTYDHAALQGDWPDEWPEGGTELHASGLTRKKGWRATEVRSWTPLDDVAYERQRQQVEVLLRALKTTKEGGEREG